VAVDGNGNAFVVWHQREGTSYSIYARRYNAGTNAWAGAVEIDAGDYTAAYPQVAFDASGNAFAIWQQIDGTYNSIYVNRYE